MLARVLMLVCLPVCGHSYRYVWPHVCIRVGGRAYMHVIDFTRARARMYAQLCVHLYLYLAMSSTAAVAATMCYHTQSRANVAK